MMIRLHKYHFTVHYERGKSIHLADMLSRGYLPYNGSHVDDIESDNMACYLPISDQLLDKIRAETRKYLSLRELSGAILFGWPEIKEDALALTHPYFSMRGELTAQDA